MSDLENLSLQQLQEAEQRAEADKQDLIAQREMKEKVIRALKVQRQNVDLPFNPKYTEATVHGLTACLREAGDGCNAKKNAAAVVAAGLLCTHKQQLCDEDLRFPLVDVPACLEQAMKDAIFCGKDFDFSVDRRVNDDVLRTIAPLLVEAQVLNLNYTRVINVTPLATLTGLRELRLYNTQTVDVAPLSALTGLQELSLGATQVTDVTPLAALVGLQVLALNSTEIAEITPLATLIGLQVLNLCYSEVPEGDAVVRELRERGVEVDIY